MPRKKQLTVEKSNELTQRKASALAQAHGKYCGSCAGPTKRSCDELLSRGVQWMTIAQDVRILSGMLAEAVKNIRGEA